MNYLCSRCIQLLEEIANHEMPRIIKNGYALAGKNGPYNNIDTPVRNSGHYLIIYSYLYSVTEKKEYLDAVKKLADYLVLKSNYGSSGSIRHRKDYRFDQTNGLIGQAWTIEALVEAYSQLGEKAYLDHAKKLYYTQKFDSRISLWHVIDCNGEEGYDLTFNHQLWFAASASILYDYIEDDKIINSINDFLNAANDLYFNVHEDGLIVHRLNYSLTEKEKQLNKALTRARKARSLLLQPIFTIHNVIANKKKDNHFLEGLEEGYHLFDLYGFAILKNNTVFAHHPIFASKKLLAATEYINKSNNIFQLEQPVGNEPFNKFAFGYNSPAFEYPFVAKSFNISEADAISEKLLEFQIQKTYDELTYSFLRQVSDPKTLTARIYELVRFLRLVMEADK